MDGHEPGLGAAMVTAGSHQPQLDRQARRGVVGTQPGHTAHIEGAGRFDQHQGQLDRCADGQGAAQTRLCR